MKVLISPSTVIEFAERNQPATLIMYSKGLSFNRKAVNDLGLKVGQEFIIVFEDGFFYMQPTAADQKGFRISTELKGGMLSPSPKLNQLIENYLKKGQKSYRFSIGEFKLGRHLLTLIPDGNGKK